MSSFTGPAHLLYQLKEDGTILPEICRVARYKQLTRHTDIAACDTSSMGLIQPSATPFLPMYLPNKCSTKANPFANRLLNAITTTKVAGRYRTSVYGTAIIDAGIIQCTTFEDVGNYIDGMYHYDIDKMFKKHWSLWREVDDSICLTTPSQCVSVLGRLTFG